MASATAAPRLTEDAFTAAKQERRNEGNEIRRRVLSRSRFHSPSPSLSPRLESTPTRLLRVYVYRCLPRASLLGLRCF